MSESVRSIAFPTRGSRIRFIARALISATAWILYTFAMLSTFLNSHTPTLGDKIMVFLLCLGAFGFSFWYPIVMIEGEILLDGKKTQKDLDQD